MDIWLYQDSGVPMVMAMVTVTLTPLSLAFSVPVIEEPPGEAAVVHQGGLRGCGVELGRGRVAALGGGVVGVLSVLLPGVGRALGPPGGSAARLPDILHSGRQRQVGGVGSELWLVVEVVRGVVTIHLHCTRGQPGGVAMVVPAVHRVAAVVTPPRAPPPAPGVRVGREGPGRVPRPVILIVVTKHPLAEADQDTRLCLLFIIPGGSDSLARARLGHCGIELTCNTAIYHHLQTSLNNHHQACQTTRWSWSNNPLSSLLSQWCLPESRQS